MTWEFSTWGTLPIFKGSPVPVRQTLCRVGFDLKGSAGSWLGWAGVTPPSHPFRAPSRGPSEGSCRGPNAGCALGRCPAFQDRPLRGALVPPQDSIYEEMEDKWSKKRAEWEKDEKSEQEKILLQQSEY